MDDTIAGAASGETVCMYGAEGFIISGKRTGEESDAIDITAAHVFP